MRVCTCGYTGKVDGRHWLQECRDGPSAEVRARAADTLRSVARDVLDAADGVNQATLNAIDKAAILLCERPGHDPETPGDQLGPPDPAGAVEWCEAVLTACGGMPHPTEGAIKQIDTRLPQETDAENPRSKETKLCITIANKLHGFWGELAPSFNTFTKDLRAMRHRLAGTAFGVSVSPERMPKVTRDAQRLSLLEELRASGAERQATGKSGPRRWRPTAPRSLCT